MQKSSLKKGDLGQYPRCTSTSSTIYFLSKCVIRVGLFGRAAGLFSGATDGRGRQRLRFDSQSGGETKNPIFLAAFCFGLDSFLPSGKKLGRVCAAAVSVSLGSLARSLTHRAVEY